MVKKFNVNPTQKKPCQSYPNLFNNNIKFNDPYSFICIAFVLDN